MQDDRSRHRHGLKRVRHRHDDALAQADWATLEMLLAEHYRTQGWEVEHCGTGATAGRFDGGVDLRLRRADAYVLVQCKHWNARQVPHNEVHQLIGIMVNASATGAILVSSGEFTAAARQAAGTHGHVQLVDGHELRRMLGPLLDRLPPAAPPPPTPSLPSSGFYASDFPQPGAATQHGSPSPGRPNRRPPWWIPLVGIGVAGLLLAWAVRNLNRAVDGLTPPPTPPPAAMRHDRPPPPPQSPARPAATAGQPTLPPGCEVIDARSGTVRCPAERAAPAITPPRPARSPQDEAALRNLLDNTPEM